MSFPALPTLHDMTALEDASGYLNARAGKYVLLVEEYINEASRRGELETGMAGVLSLIKLTELGRKKIDTHVEVRRLRDEYDLSAVPNTELEKLLSKRKENEEIIE